MPEQNIPTRTQIAEDLSRRLISTIKDGGLRVTIDRIDQPAYLVNANLEITWYNEAARPWLGDFEQLPEANRGKHVLQHLSRGIFGQRADNQSAFNKLHWEAGRARLASTAMGDMALALGADTTKGLFTELPISLWQDNQQESHFLAQISYFREGMLFVYRPGRNRVAGTLLEAFSQHDETIYSLLKKPLPALTDAVVLVADLQGVASIAQQLPPDEYFELINQLWSALEPIFKRYRGIHGKHAGDGVAYYFLPQTDGNYRHHALCCAVALRAETRKISQDWQLRKNWDVTLKLKVGLHEGNDWLGVFHSDSKVEFTLLGDTSQQAAQLSEFAVGGTIWASKTLVSKLEPEYRRKLRYGIRRRDADGLETLVEATFSPMQALIDPAKHGDKLHGIAAMAVTEIVEVAD
jgi:class 3 adenylate cyclase